MLTQTDCTVSAASVCMFKSERTFFKNFANLSASDCSEEVVVLFLGS